MGDSAALVERMSTAVRTAYKAIEVLKDENKTLKAENEALKLELRKIRSGQPVNIELEDTVDDHSHTVELPKVLLSDPLRQSVSLKPQSQKETVNAKADKLSILPQLLKSSVVDIYVHCGIMSTMTEEYGQLKPQCSLKFVNSPDAKRVSAVLAQLSADNVHVMARAISLISTETVSKALMISISSYFSMDVLGCWSNILASESLLSSNEYLLPKTLLLRLDLLSCLIVSVSSRSSNGLVRVSKSMAMMKKVILGGIRCQLESPHYALAMGTLRSHRTAESSLATLHLQDRDELSMSAPTSSTKSTVDGTQLRSEEHGLSSDSDDDVDSRGHDGVPDEALSDSDADQHSDSDREEPVARPSLAAWGQARRGADAHQSAPSAPASQKGDRKAALSSMFGLDSSSSDDEESEGGNEQGQGFTNDNDDMDIVSDDGHANDKHDNIETAEKNNKGHVSSVSANVTDTVAAVNQTTHPSHANEAIDHASKLYLLLSTLVRLRLVHELISTLRELRLVTVGNLSAGAVVAVVAVLGSKRFRALALPGVRTEVKALLEQWHSALTDDSHEETHVKSKGASSSTERLLVELLEKFRESMGLPATLPSPALGCDLHHVSIALLENISGGVRDAQELSLSFRKLGLWGALTTMTDAGKKVAHTNAFAAGVVHLSLDKLPTHAQRVQEILLHWDPSAIPCVAHSSSSPAPSMQEFVCSDDYLFSSLQCVVQQTLKTAHTAQSKLVAEELLVEELAAHWSDRLLQSSLETTHALTAIQTIRELLNNFLSTDYDVSEGGWRCGASGEGFRLSSRLDNRLTVGLALLKKLAECGGSAEHFVGSSAMLALKPSLQWLHYSSLSSRKLLEYAEFVDHCAAEVFHHSTPPHVVGGQSDSGESVRHITEGKLYAVCCEIVALLALASVEALIFAFVSSLRGLLCAVHREAKNENGSMFADVNLLTSVAACTLRELPSPWAGIARADIQHEVLAASRHLTGSESDSTEGLAEWMLKLVTAQPVFVINLDKRADRLRRLLIMSEQASVVVVRVRAFDGTTVNGDTTVTPAEMFQRNFAPAQSLTDGALPSPRALLRVKDAYSAIPESDVQLTWDSTLNNKFDPRCPVNTHTVATASERACAASHLRVWRAIAAARGTKAAKSKLRGVNNFSEETLATASEKLFSTPEDIYKSLNSLKLNRSTAGGPVKPPATKTQSSNDVLPPSQIALVEDSFCQEGTDYFIVFEDDVSFPQQSLVDLRATVRSIMRVLPPSVDILYLCGVLPKACADFKLKNIKGDPFYSINYAWTLQAYVLRSRAVEVLLSKLPICAPVDNFVGSLVYHGELRACIVKDKLTQRLAGAMLSGGGRKNDSDVRPSGRSYSGLPKRTLYSSVADNSISGKKQKVDRRKRRKH